MLSEAENQRFTQVGAGTPMGELLRRYWQPIAAVTELEQHPIKPVRLMGEDLVLYRDFNGNYGLLDRHCPHRRADLSYGFVDECGLRCNYHGWLYNEKGQCLAQPFEDIANPKANFKDKITIKAYPVEAKAGLLWAYLGPEPAPLVPTWEPFTWKNGFVQIVFAEIPCNWFQCQENSIDPIHFEWMHANWGKRLRGDTGPYSPTHTQLDFEEFEYGFTYKRIREDTDENNPLWTIGRVCLWPNKLFTGDHIEWRVPIDDENTLSVTWAFNRVPKEREPFEQESIPSWYGPIRDPQTGRWITSHVMNQDFVAWMGQGVTADRGKEHLGRSDRGISMIRKRLREDMQAVEQGEDPKAVIRDPEQNRCIDLPVVGRKILIDGMSLEEMVELGKRTGYHYVSNGYLFQAGQPEHIRQAYRDAVGITQDIEGIP